MEALKHLHAAESVTMTSIYSLFLNWSGDISFENRLHDILISTLYNFV